MSPKNELMYPFCTSIHARLGLGVSRGAAAPTSSATPTDSGGDPLNTRTARTPALLGPTAKPH
jgi:hypothetical protein